MSAEPSAPGGTAPIRAALGLGSNIGDKRAFLDAAIAAIAAIAGVRLLARSRAYKTAPWGLTEQDWFVNACVTVETVLPADDLLSRCLEIEKSLGRVRDIRWGPRKIDIDVLVYGEQTIAKDGLTIPHPRMAERAFVLVPLAEIWGDAPVGGGLTAAQALRQCPQVETVEPLERE